MRKLLRNYYLQAGLAALTGLAPLSAQAQTPVQPAGLTAAHSHQAALKSPQKKLYVCPMHPQIIQDHPGSCPICGMTLVPMAAPHDHGLQAAPQNDARQLQDPAVPAVEVDSASRQRLGVRLAKAERRPMARETQAFGNVATDESYVFNVTPKVDGWIRKLYVNAVGEQVRAGQILYDIYSPDMVQQQREYIELLQRRDQAVGSADELTGQMAQVAVSLARERVRARQKFIQADVGEDVLNEIEKSRRPMEVVPIRAQKSGFVTQIGAREGSFVTPAVNLMSFAEASKLWINIALYPDQLAYVREGDEVSVTVPHSGAAPIRGRLKFASPAADPDAHTLLARLAVNDPGRHLRPGALVDAVIRSGARTALAVPRSAVMYTGKGEKVMLAEGDGRFRPAAVELGVENDAFVEITRGLKPGDKVAVNGQFLLDAAASLSDAAARMQSHP